MRATHSFGVDFIIRRNKKDKSKALIYARVTVDGEPKEISIKEHINVEDWDTKRESVKGKSIHVKMINSLIDETRFKIKAKYRFLQEGSELITAETVKQAYLGEHTSQKGHKLLDLTEYFKKIWEGKMKPGGFKNYKTTVEYIKLFLSATFPSKDIYLSQLNTQVATDFEYFIRTKPVKKHDPCQGNGVGKHIQRLKRMVNWAVEIGWMKSNPIELYSCPLKRSRRKKLTMQELMLLEQKVFLDKTLNYAMDLFLFSCYTSFAYIDVMTLTEEDFEFQPDGKIWCKKYRVKSEELQLVLLLKNATTILAKYRNNEHSEERKTVFPFVTNQHVNRCLRVIQEACEIITPMTFHVARHTFAKTVALKNGVPMETLQMIMGHTKITTTQIYADVDEEKISDDMTNLEDRLDKKREHIWASQLKVV